MAAAVALQIKMREDVPSIKLQVLIHPPLQAVDFRTPSFLSNDLILTAEHTVGIWMTYLGVPQNALSSILQNAHNTKDFRNSIYATYVNHRSLPHQQDTDKHRAVPQSKEDADLWQVLKSKLLDSRSSPLLSDEEEIMNMTPVYLVTCGNDVVRDDGLMYKARLDRAKVLVIHKHYDNGFHGMLDVRFKEGFRAIADLTDFVKQVL